MPRRKPQRHRGVTRHFAQRLVIQHTPPTAEHVESVSSAAHCKHLTERRTALVHFIRWFPPMMMCTATGNTPFRLNLHVDDGAYLNLWSNRAGKSTLLAMLVAQMHRYHNARVFAFDKKYSMFAMSQLGGLHPDIGSVGSRKRPPLRHWRIWTAILNGAVVH